MLELLIGIGISLLLFVAGMKFESSRGSHDEELYRIAAHAFRNHCCIRHYQSGGVQPGDGGNILNAIGVDESSEIGKASTTSMDRS